MTRDFSAFFGNAPAPATPDAPTPLEVLGWQTSFSMQTDADSLAETPPVRVTSVHRSGLQAIGDGIEVVIPPRSDATVGDWFLWNEALPGDSVLLDRKSLIKRRAPGHDRSVQLIAANVDTAFIVTSCNADFSVARLERYVALALEADVTPVILLTKPDLTRDPSRYEADARAISDKVDVVTLNAKADDAAERLARWCKAGQTVAFLGSSGVGKSTLTNALSGTQDVATQAVREADAKGRHTTTRRELYFLPSGCAVLDTPGMRELQLTDAAAGVSDLFADLQDLANQCKFRDCAHDSEPGCAVTAAIASGQIDRARFERWQKLTTEDAENTAVLTERKRKQKTVSKLIKNVKKIKKR